MQMEKPTKEEEIIARSQLVLWLHPFTTLHYFFKNLQNLYIRLIANVIRQKKKVVLAALIIFLFVVLMRTNGPHQRILTPVRKKLIWCSYWLFLGILSSVGLGTGLHTFVLYLGPHIAAVTLAAYECNSLAFPEPPYPDDIICPCPDEIRPGSINIFQIMGKVRWEALMWGAGTALGELPPYFMARAARLSQEEPDDDDDDDLKEIRRLESIRKKGNMKNVGPITRVKLFIEGVIEKVGFFGILACASVPNPLFDLAGITCGHFLIPFWTFFGATLLGKAVIKMHLQKIFVIIAFNETLLERLLTAAVKVPVLGTRLQRQLKDFLEKQKLKLHKRNSGDGDGGNIIAWIYEKVVVVMIIYFIISIINSMAQSYHKKLCKQRRQHVKKF